MLDIDLSKNAVSLLLYCYNHVIMSLKGEVSIIVIYILIVTSLADTHSGRHILVYQKFIQYKNTVALKNIQS